MQNKNINLYIDDLLSDINLPTDAEIKAETKAIISGETLKNYRRPDLGGQCNSSESQSKKGQVGGPKTKELGVALFGQSEEKWAENRSEGGKKQLGNSNVDKWAKENPEEHKKTSTSGGQLGGIKSKELGLGIHGYSEEERIQNASNAGKGNTSQSQSAKGKISANSPDNVNNQKWECPDGKVTNLVWRDRYCKKRNLDISKCKRIQ
jgi:hypothetical protein